MQRPSPAIPALLCAGLSLSSVLLAQAQTPPGIRGERIPAEAISPLVRETMDVVLERARKSPPATRLEGVWNGESGVWIVPEGEEGEVEAHSGERAITNKWGDPRMAIGFGAPVDVVEVWAAGSGDAAAKAVRFVGTRDGKEVAKTEWLDLEEDMQRCKLDLKGIDRLEVQLRPAVGQQGWISLDDLTFRDAAGTTHRLDFEDLPPRYELTGSGYAGLKWEVGSGFHLENGDIVPAPRIESSGTAPVEEPHGPLTSVIEGGTTPVMWTDMDTVRQGDPGANLIPPDTHGAAGPDYFVSIVNANLSAYRVSDGMRLVNTDLKSFFPGSSGTVGDPRIVFDPDSQRFIAMATNFSTSATVYVAVSATDDPTGAWFKFSYQTDQGIDAGKWPDYPTLGVDANGIYLSAFMVGRRGTMTIWAIDKAPLIAGMPSLGTITAFRGLPFEGSIQPCTTYGNPGSEYLVSRLSSTALRLRQVMPPLTAPTLVETGSVTIPPHSTPPSAPAKGSSVPISTVDERLMNAVFRNGSVWTTQGVAFNGRSACRWYELDTQNLTLAQVGTIGDPVWYYYFATIAVDAAGNVALGFSGSHANAYASAFYTGRLASDPPGQTAPPVLYKDGEGPWLRLDSSGRNRFGDYSNTTVDPNDEIGFWTIQEYILPGNNWGTRLARLGYEAIEYGVGLAGTAGIPGLRAHDRPVIGQSLTLDIDNSLGNSPGSGLLLVGVSRAAQPVLGGTLLVSPLAAVPVALTGAQGSMSIAVPNSSTAVGFPVDLQFGQTDAGAPQGIALSAGLEVRAGSR